MPTHTLIVTDQPEGWPLSVTGVRVVPAREYLADPAFAALERAVVLNACRRYRYQSLGYYVSLLATARGHRVLPSVQTMEDLRIAPLVRLASEDLDALIQRSLRRIKAPTFELSSYLGRNLSHTYDPLAHALFEQYPAPFLRASFERSEDGRWQLVRVRLVAAAGIPPEHHGFVLERLEHYFSGRYRRPRSGTRSARYDLAMLVNPDEALPPSNARALERFARAAAREGLSTTRIGPDDYARVGEFDALFIRETTAVNHHTYRFARRAEADGLVVMDDPSSIVRCTNKVFQAEAFDQHGIPAPRTLVVDRRTAPDIVVQLGFPCVLKRPDSSFSQGVVKARDTAELEQHLERFFADSELVVAQEFAPSGFDWRVGVIAGQPFYVCRYHMAEGHWQIVGRTKTGRHRHGGSDALAVADAPARVVRLAVRAARLMGDGLYGVDLKEIGRRILVMEVNDNPSLEAGVEDAVAGEALYATIMRTFRQRLDARRPRG